MNLDSVFGKPQFTVTEQPLFVNSVFRTVIADTDFDGLINIVEHYSKTKPSTKRSNSGGWQSEFCINHYDNDIVKDLFENKIKHIAHNIIKYNFKYDYMYKNVEYWYNLNKPYSYNLDHTHPRSMLSGAYYIRVPKDCGRITFIRNDSETVDMVDFFDKNSKQDTSTLTQAQYWIEPVVGELVMFPGHLRHYVEQNMSGEDRITLSFNFRL